MTSRVSLLALSVGAYFAFALASFPASIAHRWFGSELTMAGIDGSVWQGSAAYVGFNGLALSDFRWQLHPAALLTGRLSLSAEARVADALARTELTYRGGNVVLSGLRMSADLANFRQMLAADQIGGSVNVTLERLELIDGWPVSASGVLRLTELSWPPLIPVPGVPTIPLGNFLAQFTVDDEPGIVAFVNDEGGPLELEGRIDLTPDRTYHLKATIKPRADASNALVQGLMVMNPADANGYHTIEFSQQL